MDTENGQNKGFVEADITTWNEADYRRLLNFIEQLFLAEEGTPASDRANVLFDRIEAYEQSHYRIAEWIGANAEKSLLKRKPAKSRDLIPA